MAILDPKSLLDPTMMARLERLELLTRRTFRGRQKGERRSRKKGISIDFADYRDYVRGDDTRFIDWNIFARLEKLFIKLFLEEEDLAFYLILDTSLSMSFGEPETKFDYARKLAAALAYIALTNQDKVAVTAMGDGANEVCRLLRGKGQLPKILTGLASLEPSGGTQLQHSVKSFVHRNTQPGVVVVLSDFLDESGFEEALKYFFLRNYEVYCIHILSPEERVPNLGGHLELVDSETGTVQEITVDEAIIKQYQLTVEKFCSSIREWCRLRGIAYLPATTNEPMDVMLLNYLRGVGLLR